MSASIIVTEDEADLREAVGEYLRRHGLDVRTAADAVALSALLQDRTADVIVLDVAMPGEDGLAVARRLRGDGYPGGIVMLTAAGDVVDRVVGLELGADDYLAKPCDLRELLARIRSVLRRVSLRGAATAAPQGPRVRLGRRMLDLAARKLIGPDGAEIPLTAMEFDLLKAFAERPGRVLSRESLLELAHSRGWEAFDRSIDVRITRLRRKIEDDPSKPAVIKTVRGAGYVLAPDALG